MSAIVRKSPTNETTKLSGGTVKQESGSGQPLAPILTIRFQNQTGQVTPPIRAGTVTAVFSWSEHVTGFSESSVGRRWFDADGDPGYPGGFTNFTGGTGSQVYTALITFPADARGTLELSVPAGIATSVANPTATGPPSPVTVSVGYDTHIFQATTPDVEVVNKNVAAVTEIHDLEVLWSEDVTNFSLNDCNITQGSLVSLTEIRPDYYIIGWQPPTGAANTVFTIYAESANGAQRAGPSVDYNVTLTFDRGVFPEVYLDNGTIATPVGPAYSPTWSQIGGAYSGVFEIIKHGSSFFLVAQKVFNRTIETKDFLATDIEAVHI